MTQRGEFSVGDLVEIVIKTAKVTHSDYAELTVVIEDDNEYDVEIELPYSLAEGPEPLIVLKKVQFPRRKGDVWELNDGQMIVIFGENPGLCYFSLTTLGQGMVSDVNWHNAERLTNLP